MEVECEREQNLRMQKAFNARLRHLNLILRAVGSHGSHELRKNNVRYAREKDPCVASRVARKMMATSLGESGSRNFQRRRGRKGGRWLMECHGSRESQEEGGL